MTQEPPDPAQPEASEADEDPVVEEILRDSLDALEEFLSPEEMIDHRRVLTMVIKTHPAALPLYERIRTRRAPIGVSGDMVREGVDEEPAPPVQRDGTFGGPRK